MLKGAIVGFGEVARHGHWPAYAASTEAEIVAVVDRNVARRALASSLKPGLQTFETIAELAASITVDFIDICTPPVLHPQPMLDAIDRGWHVLCEKPLLLDLAVVETVRQRAAEHATAVVPVHNWKYAPILVAATAALRDGAIGSLTRVEIETARVRAAQTAQPDRPNWRRDAAIAGGGILMDHGWHSVYLALHWFEAHATAVHASLHHPPGGGVEDEASLRIEFPEGEALISLSWNCPRRRNSMRLVGTDGEIVIADDTLGIRGANTLMTTFPSALSSGSHHEDWFTAMLPAVVACFRHPALARPLFDEAVECLSIIQQAYRGDHSLA